MISIDEMRDVKDFEGMDPEMLAKLAEIGDVISAPAGTYLFREGDHAENYYILREGKVVLEFREGEKPVYTETVGPGMGVGCSSLAGLSAYMSDARCEEPSRLLCWPQSKLRHLFNQYDRIGYMMMKACAMSFHERIGVTH
ncbi:MAG: cyclic nucleotide-binding domain-containing protein [Deltaproteobacteria bacterium]|nr:cyclic nucleotide-binding domain-containing protein [Deltaproteobacteria bacterium]MBW2050314.1 cyclic nucleotide-binding domain-containing protein [Deltaproteobacteria bacterium]MBW2112968.1 cyclic nucleotide-binding domain-containing protein [Deltaproteobacteria bacterium]MBW2352327.1 cyclic nucleotide-binding domain-containing protein [Deltaproteobacteria bacterium]